MNHKLLFGLLAGVSLAIPAAHAAEITLTPNANGGGELPSGYDKITFNMADGNWTRDITLPATPANGAQVVINSSATMASSVDTTKADLLLDTLAVRKSDSFQFTFRSTTGKWTLAGDNVGHYSPNKNGASIPENHPRISYYNMADGNWTKGVNLPATANGGDIAVIRSNATWNSRVSGANLLYNSTNIVKRGDEYAFVYNKNYQRWLLESSPLRVLRADQVGASMAKPTSPTTQVKFWDGNYVGKITLPLSPGDRDRVILSSTATWSAAVDGSNILDYDKLSLNTGDEYEFMYVAEKTSWVLMRSPTTTFAASKLSGGVLPALKRPRTKVRFADGNWVRDLYLPIPSPKNHRVIVESNAGWSFSVHGIDNNRDTKVPMHRGQTIAFIVDETGKWQQETIVIDILLLYSDKAAQKIGEAAERKRLLESFNMTNEALENSGANFRLRRVGLQMITAPESWKVTNDPLTALRDHETVQNLRNKLKADAIFYDGTEAGCGLAWTRASAYNMVAVGSHSCGTTVMRHEFGHNMSLNHGVATDNTNGKYAVGNSRVTTIMGGNAIPYYATPNRYTEKHGIPLGVEGQVDAVRAMNEFSAQVAAYR